MRQVFNSEKDICLENTWRKRRRYETFYGTKQFFYCNQDQKCPIEAYLWYNNKKEEVEFYVQDGPEHVHGPKKVINNELKEKVSKLLKEGICQPRIIMRNLN